MVDENAQWFFVERDLGNAADRALLVETPRTIRVHLKRLLGLARDHFDAIADFEGLDTPEAIAARKLNERTMDERLLLGVLPQNIDPNSEYSKELHKKRNNFIRARSLLGEIIDQGTEK